MDARDGDVQGRRRIALACQGGGSHTAFTAGVLRGLLRSERLEGCDVVAISGTSGGAVCALLAWHHLLRDDVAGAGEALDAFWRDNSATTPQERVVNDWMVWAGRLQDYVALPAVSPYQNPFSGVGLDAFKKMLERRVDFGGIGVQGAGSHPALLVGAVDVLSGEFRTFNSRRDRISPETILASAAIPTLFRSIPLEGGLYWDGLFSQNPPIEELTDERPDEIWVIQINPKELDREPKTVTEISDRRNELAGNLSLHQELRFIEKIDRMLEDGRLAGDGKYKQIVVRLIELSRSRLPASLGPASKLNRDPAFISELISHGEDRAREFLSALSFEEAWLNQDAESVLGFFADDATLVSSAPFPVEGRYEGKEQIRPFVEERLTREVRLDLTRKQVARDGAAWTIRRASGDGYDDRTEGVARATFRKDKILSLRLGPPG